MYYTNSKNIYCKYKVKFHSPLNTANTNPNLKAAFNNRKGCLYLSLYILPLHILSPILSAVFFCQAKHLHILSHYSFGLPLLIPLDWQLNLQQISLNIPSISLSVQANSILPCYFCSQSIHPERCL